ncbi:MAG: Bcr/CflA family drug resistance efflux transporter [marine bacterium B5-7]|nr:MAG: Bcr/CflA family drug resistance efflux transporter [marine bacterium B5-7]
MKSLKLLFLNIILIGCLGQAASDIYMPSMSAISTAFHAPISLVQLSMAIYMLGYGLSQLIYGPLSEGVGRRLPLVAGLLIMLVGTFVCAHAQSIHALIVGRLIQGCGAGAGGALWRTIFRDTFKGEELAKYGSYFSMIMIFAVPAVPMLGGYLQHYLGWRANFHFLSLYSFVTMLAVIFLLKETSAHHHKERLKPRFILSTFSMMLTNRVFMGLVSCIFLTYGAFFSWLVVSPALLMNQLNMTPVAFGWVILASSSFPMFIASQLNAKLVTKLGMSFMLNVGWGLMVISGVMLLAGHLFWGVNVYAIIVPIMIFYTGATLVWPNVFATAFTPFGHIAGYAGALYSSLQIAGGAVVGAIVAHLPHTTQVPFAWVTIICPALAWCVYYFYVKPALDRAN